MIGTLRRLVMCNPWIFSRLRFHFFFFFLRNRGAIFVIYLVYRFREKEYFVFARNLEDIFMSLPFY